MSDTGFIGFTELGAIPTVDPGVAALPTEFIDVGATPEPETGKTLGAMEEPVGAITLLALGVVVCPTPAKGSTLGVLIGAPVLGGTAVDGAAFKPEAVGVLEVRPLPP